MPDSSHGQTASSWADNLISNQSSAHTSTSHANTIDRTRICKQTDSDYKQQIRPNYGIQARREGENVRAVVPSPYDQGSGERDKLPQRGPGQSPGRKWILCIFQVRKKPSGTPFSVFLSDGGAPKTSRGPGKLSPLPPSRRAWPTSTRLNCRVKSRRRCQNRIRSQLTTTADGFDSAYNLETGQTDSMAV